MSDDWDSIIGATPTPTGAGRGRTRVSDEWGSAGPADSWGGPPALKKLDESWGAGPNGFDQANPLDSWGGPPAATNNSTLQETWGGGPNGFNDQPRGGGFSSGGGGGARGSGCFKCGQDGHMSRECPNGGGGGGGRGCHKCGEEGHMARECPTGGGGSRACHKCGEEGHMARECPSGDGGGAGKGCFNCGEDGHMSRECPNPKKERARTCNKCGNEGHMAWECPDADAGGGGGAKRGCFNCSSEDHMSRDCPESRKGGSNCYNCGGDGHMSRDCPEPRKERPGDSGKCHKCHEEGHMSRDCPNPYSELTEDGKPRERYIPEESTDVFSSGITSGSNFSNFDKILIQVTGEDVPKSITSFESANIRELVLQNIKNSGYLKPTPIQRGSIPIVLARRDLMASAVTGSGKTAAYLVPVINILLEKGTAGGSSDSCQTPQVVIIAPTRELAIQINNEARKFSHNSVLKTVIIYGGTVVSHQLNQLRNGCNILVATPGRLKHFVEQNALNFSEVNFFILDEADRMLDMGFGADIDAIAKHPTMPPVGKRQTLMFSATFPSDVQKLARQYLHDYCFVTTGTVGGTNPDISQVFYEVAGREKKDKLLEVLQEIGSARTIVFVESKKTADFVASFLSNKQIQATSIHGDRLQSQRELALRELKSGVRNVLVATNVAARGLDIAGVEYVVNYDLPTDVEEYVHRIGRTGRVGNIGKSISFYNEEKDSANAGKLVEKLVASGADVPDFLSNSVSGMGGMGYNFNAPSQSNDLFASQDMRKFGNDRVVTTEAEAAWD